MPVHPGEDRSELAALRAQREEMHRELVRKTFRIGELEEEIRETKRTYEESLSWRITRPIRSAKLLLGALRGP
ncbi:MAG TPA: hypothetical protein VHU86_09585 [Solirubrobacterales bacterium]|jgi:hypothetical protein|nr:hypothetical protein [Solirubrobacterales bacterium]